MLLFLFSYSSIHSRIIHMHIRSLTINVHLWTKSSTQFHKIIISFSLVFISIYFQKLLKRIKIFFTFKLLWCLHIYIFNSSDNLMRGKAGKCMKYPNIAIKIIRSVLFVPTLNSHWNTRQIEHKTLPVCLYQPLLSLNVSVEQMFNAPTVIKW